MTRRGQESGSFDLIPQSPKIVSKMHTTTNVGSSKKKENKWLSSTIDDRNPKEDHGLEAILSFNGPLSPIRPMPIALQGINQQLLSSGRIFPI